MSSIPDYSDLISPIQETGFVCQRCGTCCRETEPGSNIVMVSPGEVRSIMAYTGLTFDEVAEPYPDTIRDGDREYTLGWAIIRGHDQCTFLINGSCSIYEVRPWICRTYPFMLENDHLTVSPCNAVGIGRPDLDMDTAEKIAHDLLIRQKTEKEEEDRIAKILPDIQIPPGQMVVIDGEGMRIIHG